MIGQFFSLKWFRKRAMCAFRSEIINQPCLQIRELWVPKEDVVTEMWPGVYIVFTNQGFYCIQYRFPCTWQVFCICCTKERWAEKDNF